MDKNKVRISMVIKLSGSYCAFLIGAGFATGQEILQYFTSYGFVYSILGLLMSLVLGAWTVGEVMNVGYKNDDSLGTKAYRALCGKYIGGVLSFFIPIFMFLTLVIMIAGAGATFTEQFAIPNEVGKLILAVLVGLTVFFGLSRVVDTIGFIGPAIIVISIVVGLGVLIMNPLDIQASNAFIASKVESGEILQAADSYWMSAILYVLWGIVMGLPFVSAMGSQAQNNKEIIWGTIIGNLLFNIALAIMSFGMAGIIEKIYSNSIPAVSMANNIHPVLGVVYSIILIAAIYTTAVPLLWSVAARIAREKTKLYYFAIVVILVLGFFGAVIPFETLINYIYPAIGYLGFFMFACIIWKDIQFFRKWFSRKKNHLDENSETAG